MESGAYYHVYNRGVNRETIFKEAKNYPYFLLKYDQYLSPVVDTFCYCLMPNHFHFFVRIKEDCEDGAVIKAFKDFFISYAKSINKGYDRTGSLFQSKFKKKEIDSDAYYSMIIAYIHLNPLRASLVSSIADWKYSSYPAIVSHAPTKVCRKEVIEWFGGHKAFVDFHQSFDDGSEAKSVLY
ncbi:transposase [Marinoscillum sp.]|uniref:transposase n=1 Tax=Marinoscillum sp. TaxID=2024838 RepID=UPI003BABB1FB